MPGGPTADGSFKALTTTTRKKPTHGDPLVQKVLDAFPQIRDAEYAAQLCEKFKRYTNPFATVCIWLGDAFTKMRKEKTQVAQTPFTAFIKERQTMTPYHRLCMADLQGRHNWLKPEIIISAFNECNRLFIPTGVLLDNELDYDSVPPTYKKQPIELLAVARDQPVLDLRDQHFDADNQFLENDAQAAAYIEKYEDQSGRFANYPPLPTSFQKAAVIGDQPLLMECHKCNNDQPNFALTDMVACKDGHTHCHACFAKELDLAIARGQQVVQCQLKIERLQIDCHSPFDDAAVLEFLSEADIKRLRGAILASKFPSDTVYSGVCPHCYFPLRREWTKPRVWRCSRDGCGGEFFLM